MQGMDAEGLALALRSMGRLDPGEGLERAVGDQMVDFALQQTGFERAVVLSAGHEQRPTVLINRDVDEAYVRFLLDNYVRMPGMKSLESGETLVVDDVRGSPVYAEVVDRMEAAGLRSLVVFPMRALGQELMGALVIYHSAPQTLDEQAVRFTEAVVAHGSLTIANHRLLGARRYLLEQTVLEKSQEVVAVLAAGIAHDFNNLLGSLLSLVSLTTTLDPRELKTAVRSLEIQVQQAASLSRNLLELARPAGIDSAPEPADLLSAARDAVAMVRPALHGNTRLVVEPVGEWLDEPLLARIDRAAFSRVVLNLLLNALHAVEGLRDGRIIVRLFHDGAFCVAEVDDNGPGVPPGDEDAIFEPFVSLAKGSGTGVGLPAARGIVERAGGTLTLRHREGPGACFAVRLPAAVATQDREGGTISDFTDTEIMAVPGERLLLAEDQPMQRQAFAQALRRAGYEVDEACDGREALDALESESYGAVLLDHAMPEVTGASILAFLRADGSEVPVILISGFGHDPQLNDLARDGLTRILSKPFRPDALVREVRRLLHGAPLPPQQ